MNLTEANLITEKIIAEQEIKTIHMIRETIKRKTFLFRSETEVAEKDLKRELKTFLTNLNQIWHTSAKLTIDFSDPVKCSITGGGAYFPEKHTIILFRPSILLLLHEFKHHLQYIYNFKYVVSFDDSNPEINLEMDAILWSYSLISLALANTNFIGSECLVSELKPLFSFIDKNLINKMSYPFVFQKIYPDVIINGNATDDKMMNLMIRP